MADIVIDSATSSHQTRAMRNIVFVNSMTGYLFYIDGDNDLYYKKTTNGGITWGTNVTVQGSETIHAVDVWYDQWTPGDTGRSIHIWYFGVTADDVMYTRLNTTNDALLTPVQVFNGSTSVAGRGVFVSGTKTRGGNLLCTFDIDAAAEKGMYRSVDNGATWSAMTDPVEATNDQCLMFPANVADANDAWLLYHDADTDELTLKEYDNSGNSFTESAALTMAENTSDATGQYGFSGAIRHSDGHLIIAFMDAYDAAGASDFKVYDINSTGSLTALTDIATNVDDIYWPVVFIDQKTDAIYVGYIGKSDGTETITSSAKVYYAKSTDRGVSWTKDVAYMDAAAGDVLHTFAPVSGPRFMIEWWRTTGFGLETNHVNSVDVGSPSLNNYSFAGAKGVNNSGILSVTERIR